jgi:hypothetical protein
MEEKVFEMEYVINGEKYLITATKVTEDLESTATADVCKECDTPYEKYEDSYEFTDNVITFKVKDIPDGMDIETWLSIVDKFGIVLTK